MRKIEAIMAHLERELDEKLLESPSQSNLVGAGLLVESMGKQLDQAIIFDKTIRARLESDLEGIRKSVEGTNASAGEAKERLAVFRSFFQASFSGGQIV